ncbi:mechanosensitive ion channel family protein [Aliirhizobium smilacinae]|uniref:Mechanosensitive ion channel family protein n=1 Tax=Aliirhizobium smilacinae TaxID=1395944 RepID=A0A5C4XHG4_9HYPH|nr:mechanosensitive ion channel domain-containing protein [Rhizobium smilacinae]TNM62014.1 mechanosensitive ion channel family protein [Rhizobium smilacinae]
MNPSFFLGRRLGELLDLFRGRMSIALLLSLAVSSGFAHDAAAQSQPPAQPSAQVQTDQAAPTDVTADSINIEMKDKLDGLRQQLSAFRESVNTAADDDAKLADIRVRAEAIVEDMRVASDAMKVRVEQIQGRITSLGEPPATGQPAEAPAVAEERGKLQNERSQLNLIVDDAGNLQNSATQLANTITNLRRALFAQTLFRHTELTPEVFVDAGNAFITEMRDFSSTIASWTSFVWRFKAFSLLGAIGLSVGAAFLFLAGGYRLFGRFLRRNDSANPAYIKRLSYTFWSTVMQSVSFAAFLITSYLFLEGFNVLRPDVAPMIATFFGFVWFVHFVWKLTYAALAPNETGWRLVRITDRGARLLSLAIIAMAVVNGLDYLLGAVSEALGSPLVLTIAKSLIASVVIGLILIAISFIRPVMTEGEDPTGQGRPWPRYFSVALRVMGGLLLLCVIAGYVGLARFASTQIVLTGAVLALIYIGILSGKAIAKRGAFNDTALGRRLVERHRFGEIGLDQAGLLVGLGIYVIALALGIPLILITWGFQITDIESWVVSFFTEFRIGSISISIVGIFGGVLLFALGYIVTRWAQKWIDGNVLARSHVDIGVRNSVKTGIGYLGVGLAVIIGVSAAGINLSNLALVASALSVGIGFGLQNIVSNFVSGLILLVERPFKVGDHVVTGTTEGIVKRISVRATEIETFRQQAIIVPNSDLINAAVGNWTLKNRIQRSEIKVSVSYESDPEKVMAILLAIVEKVPEILRNPGPHVEFLAFGGSSLDFELRFHLADMSEGLRVRNDIRIEILKQFREQGVEIPFPRSEVVYHRGSPILLEEPDVRGGA